ncbi:MAG TPA: VOC family protein [Micromonosporaceae bacterium]|nr:VOC family protein [Micromonosporaceae bacterium]
MDYRLEVAMVPVSDVDQTKEFYQGIGWRLDADFPLGDGVRVVQLTPPGSACSVSFGTGVGPGNELVVNDIDAARKELNGRGVNVSEVFHRDGAKQVPGPAPNHESYNSYASFKDPDGNAWLLQEVTERRPGRTTSPLAAYGSVDNLADALRRASAAHGQHEQEIGHADADWPSWYAQYMADESKSI